MNRRKIYGDLMEQCGHDVNYFEIYKKKEKNKILPKDIKKVKPDIVWFYNPIYIRNNPDAVDYIRSKKIPIALYATYIPSFPYTECMDIWSKADFLFVQNSELNQFLVGKGLNSYYVPMGFHPSQYYKSDVSVPKKYDISFCGTSLRKESASVDKRAKYLRAIRKHNVVVYGKTFEGKVKDIPVKFYESHDEQREVYYKTKINLDLPFFYSSPDFYKDKYHAKNRLFEVPATNNFLLTVRCPEFLDLFDEDTVGYYDDNIESLKSSIDKYLKDDKLRIKMAERSYKLVNEKHTFLHRFKQMFKIIES
jgi:spore maturation protein CgeB